MTPARAAEVLRGEKATAYDRVRAEVMGADALEMLEWLFKTDGYGTMAIDVLESEWNGEDSFLDYARAEWEKERKG
jgi:hypothetical protein